jgi:photosystem II stability/assembly factor-like uncharacterized protein
MKHKILITLGALALLAASCNPFAPTTPAGVIKSANGGADWQFSNKIADQPKATLGSLNITQLIFDPNKTDQIFVSTDNDGIYKSEDGGSTWKNILSRFTTYDFAINPRDVNTIYAAGIFDDRGRVLATHDGGKSWQEVFNEASSGNVVRTVALNPDNPQELVIGLNSGHIIKSRDQGGTWSLLQNYNERVSRLRWHNGRLFAVIPNNGVYRSDDGGASFQNITASLSGPNNFSGVLISGSGIATFNQLAISSSNPNLMYLTTSGGLYRTDNGGSTWTFLPLPLRQRDVRIWAVSVAPTSDNVVYVSAGSNVYKTSDGGSTWQTQNTHTSGQVTTFAVHPLLPQIVYAGVFNQ